MSRGRILGIIPARHAASRFPGKVLAPILGKPLIGWVVENARSCKYFDDVIVATDDGRVVEVARSFGARAVLTPTSCASGTDRVALVVQGEPADVVVNIQADEPLLSGAVLDAAVQSFLREPQVQMATLRCPIDTAAELSDPNVVKVVTRHNDDALYFSRAAIPFGNGPMHAYRHIGLYLYRRQTLLKFTALDRGELERVEQLEQLRALEAGFPIRVYATSTRTVAIDVPSDVATVEQILETAGCASLR